MFERFTDRARRIVVLAQEEARLLSHDYIGTEHLLLGLIHEGEGVAALVLKDLGANLDDMRNRIEEIIGNNTKQVTIGYHIPFTPRGKKVLELSLREALQLGHNYIGTEHVLLGLIREGEGVGAQVLVQANIGLSDVRQAVIKRLNQQGDLAPPVARSMTPVGETGPELLTDRPKAPLLRGEGGEILINMDMDQGPVFATRSRMGPSVYWGPFATLREGFAWAQAHNLSVAFHRMLDPETPESEWWNQGTL